MGWLMWDMKNTFVCIMVRMNLPEVIATLMALNPSGHMPNEDLQSSIGILRWTPTVGQLGIKNKLRT